MLPSVRSLHCSSHTQALISWPALSRNQIHTREALFHLHSLAPWQLFLSFHPSVQDLIFYRRWTLHTSFSSLSASVHNPCNNAVIIVLRFNRPWFWNYDKKKCSQTVKHCSGYFQFLFESFSIAVFWLWRCKGSDLFTSLLCSHSPVLHHFQPCKYRTFFFIDMLFSL